MSEGKRIRVRWVKSAIGFTRRQRATIRGLGLKRLNQTVEVVDTPANRGMIRKVYHFLIVEN